MENFSLCLHYHSSGFPGTGGYIIQFAKKVPGQHLDLASLGVRNGNAIRALKSGH